MINGDRECSSGRCGRRRRSRTPKSARPRSCAIDVKMIRLRQWMKERAGFNNNLYPAVFTDTGRGLMTKKRISAGETIVSLPHCLLINTDTVFNSDIGSIVKGWDPPLLPQHCLAIYLLWEKHKRHRSAWFPYIDSLPVTFTTPAYFSHTDLSPLPDNVRIKATREKQKVMDLYKETVTFSLQVWKVFYDVLTYEDFRWAWYVINTRSVYMEMGICEYLSPEEPNNIALAPFLDLLNHSPVANITASFNRTSNCYEIVTNDNYKPYQQVFISYGCHGNQKLFIDYGFCVPNNLHDAVEISYDSLMKACQRRKVDLIDRKLALLREHDLLSKFTCSMEGISWKLWTVLRTLTMDWSQLQRWSQLFAQEQSADDTDPETKSLAADVIQEYLWDNGRNQKQANIIEKNEGKKDHMQIVKYLLSIERDILRVSKPS